ncbi:MAG: Holliday junction resolvase RuvX [Fibrobacteres bacterium]|nr:Holliday junction resolvase RuvX [Fibrobacterota bacterium]
MAALLGIDFGERRIGLAVSDSSGILATPLDTIDTKKSEPFLAIKDYADEYDADTLVVGYPLRTDGTVGEKATVVDAFIENLAKVCPGKRIVKQDERYSSSDAQALIRNSGRKKGKKPIDKSIIDRMAAAIILQEYIDSNKAVG